MKIVLLGFMCSGKSKVGTILAKKLRWPHYDTDLVIEQQSGSTVADIITRHGEEIFRDMERQAVVELSQKDNCVISTGGGVPLDRRNMENLKKQSITFWLKVTPRKVLSRSGNLKKRPLINTDKPLETIRDLLQQRREFYEVADYRIDTDELTPEQVAEIVMGFLPNVKMNGTSAR